MSVFKVQRIHSCTQCGTVLGLKCKACVKHPDRKPQSIELYGYPTPLKVAECGCCVLLPCQRDTCKKTFWRFVAKYKTRLTRAKGLYCSHLCSCLSMSESRKTRTAVRCAWHECSTMVERKLSQLSLFKHSFCRPDHKVLFYAKIRHDEIQALVKKMKSDMVGLLYCKKCVDVTEHDTPTAGLSTCKICQSKRDAKILCNNKFALR